MDHKQIHTRKQKLKAVYKLIEKKFVLVTAVMVILIALTIIITPSFSYSAGEVFFGGFRQLYHLKIAKFLYTRAAYPFFSIKEPPYAHHQLSRVYFIKGDSNAALEEAKKELEVYPNNTSTYYILGLTYGYMNRTHEAIDAFSKYIETHPDTWAGRNDNAWLQFRIGDIDGAIKTIEPIAENFRYTAWVQNTYCALLINKKDYKEAKKRCGYAKDAVDKMSPNEWGRAYPGNDPRIYEAGLQSMNKSISQNLYLIEQSTTKKGQPQ